MERRRLGALVGLGMVILGVVQAGLYAGQAEWIPTALGLFYLALGVAYLRAEVFHRRLI
ncbi:hypothetical protein [Natrinema halophilum]|uniref:Uncharacterized protein n=1 Tax=Natrinema halophilum TaxID=1699371 RepID=A0A7D5H3S2_9EURY|nr:hypothetical protein [Natrinema halophilum]QLG50031.1 hypothetical protein HYG82_14785 [Natrinema halophilum]